MTISMKPGNNSIINDIFISKVQIQSPYGNQCQQHISSNRMGSGIKRGSGNQLHKAGLIATAALPATGKQDARNSISSLSVVGLVDALSKVSTSLNSTLTAQSAGGQMNTNLKADL